MSSIINFFLLHVQANKFLHVGQNQFYNFLNNNLTEMSWIKSSDGFLFLQLLSANVLYLRIFFIYRYVTRFPFAYDTLCRSACQECLSVTVLSVPGPGKWWSTILSGTCVNNVKIWFVSDSAVCARPWQVVVDQSVRNLCE